MTSNRYIIDTSSLIELNKYNPRDIYPSVWRNIESLISKGFLIAPKEVLDEITEGDDQLAKWAKSQSKLFREPTKEQIRILKDILKDYPQLVKDYRKYDADAWVIALAIEMSTNQQQTLTPLNSIVITEEKIRGNKIKIPFVCKKFNIQTVDIIGMFREEGWRF